MGIKKDFTRILKESAQKSDEAQKQIVGICTSSDYTESGKRNAAASIQKDMNAYLDRQRAAVNKAVQSKCEGLEAFEDLQLRKKNEDKEYQSLLASTLAILPEIAINADPEDLKNRLAPFADDPTAISAIKSVLEKTTAEQAEPGRKTLAMVNSYVIPENNRGKKAMQLQKLQKTMLDHLDNMTVNVGEKAFTSDDNSTVYGSVRGGSIISATLDYIAACNDDCTEFSGEQQQAGQSDPGGGFNFGFSHIR